MRESVCAFSTMLLEVKNAFPLSHHFTVIQYHTNSNKKNK